MQKYIYLFCFFFLALPLRAEEQKHPRVGVVLSGGGARGLAEIGALKVLEQNHIPIDLIVGTSMGSVIGGLYSAGYSLSELESLAIHTDWNLLLSISGETERTSLFVGQKEEEEQGFVLLRFEGFQPVFPSAISNGQRVTNFLNELCLQSLYYPKHNFDELKIPFRSVTTDLVSGKRLVLSGGSLTEALRASISVPLMFAPLKKDSMQLVDGGLISNIPVDVAKGAKCDYIIVINTTSKLRTPQQMQVPWESADQIMNIMMVIPNNEQLKDANVVITPEIGNYLTSDFTGVAMLIAEGEKATKEKIPEILSHLSTRIQKGEGELSMSDSSKFQQEPVLSSVRFQGNLKLEVSVLHSTLNKYFGKTVNAKDISIIHEAIEERYRSAGYSIAEIDSITISPTGEMLITINEGKISGIRISGNRHTADYVALRELPMVPGDIFSIEDAKEGVKNLIGTGLFEQVYIEVEKEGKENIVVAHLVEKNTEIIRTGFRLDNERNFQVLLDISQENILNAGQELGLGFAGGFRNRLFRLRYNVNRIFNSYFTGNINTYYKVRDIYLFENATSAPDELTHITYGEYSEIKYGGAFSFGSQVARFGNVNAEMRVENQQTKELTSRHPFVGDRFTLSSVKGSLLIDSEDEFVFPTSGVKFIISYEIATKSLGSERSFTKIFAMHQSYWSPFPGHTFRPRITLGLADETLPLSEQFFLGGLESFLGKREDDTRGRQLLLMNMEYRYRLPVKILFDTYLKLRYDLGIISEKLPALTWRNFEHGAGVELALDTPIGSASIAAGKEFIFKKALLDTEVKFGPTVAYFSIGYKF